MGLVDGAVEVVDPVAVVLAAADHGVAGRRGLRQAGAGNRPRRIALVAPTLDVARAVMVEGESGLMARLGLAMDHGALRVSLADKLDRQSKRLVALEAWAKKRYYGFGKYVMPADVVKKLARHRAKLERLNKQITKINETDYAERKGSKSVAARRGTTPSATALKMSFSCPSLRALVRSATGCP